MFELNEEDAGKQDSSPKRFSRSQLTGSHGSPWIYEPRERREFNESFFVARASSTSWRQSNQLPVYLLRRGAHQSSVVDELEGEVTASSRVLRISFLIQAASVVFLAFSAALFLGTAPLWLSGPAYFLLAVWAAVVIYLNSLRRSYDSLSNIVALSLMPAAGLSLLVHYGLESSSPLWIVSGFGLLASALFLKVASAHHRVLLNEWRSPQVELPLRTIYLLDIHCSPEKLETEAVDRFLKLLTPEFAEKLEEVQRVAGYASAQKELQELFEKSRADSTSS